MSSEWSVSAAGSLRGDTPSSTDVPTGASIGGWNGGVGARLGLSGVLAVWWVDVVSAAGESMGRGSHVLTVLATAGTIVTAIALVRSVVIRSTGSNRSRGVALMIAIIGLFTARGAVEGLDLERMRRTSVALDGCIVRIEGIVDSHQPVESRGRGRDETSGWIGTIRADRGSSPGFAGLEIRYRMVGDDPGVAPGMRCRMRGLWKSNGGAASTSIRRSPGTLSVGHSDLITTLPGSDPLIAWRSRMRSSWLAAVDWVRSFDHGNLGASGVLDAILTGRRGGLDPELRIDARRSGLAHLLAISGLHLTLVGGGVLLVLGRRRSGRLVGLMTVICFASVVASSPSIVRAVSMAVVGGSCLLLGRRPRGRSVLMLVLAGMVWLEPMIVRSAGFQLSAVATTGLVWSSTTARRRWFGPRDRLGIARSAWFRHRFSVVATAALVAWISTLPILIGRFGLVAIPAVPASILGTPLLAAAMVVGLLASVVRMLSPWESPAIDLVSTILARGAVWSSSVLVDLIRGCGSLVDPISLPTSGWGELAALPLALALAIGLGRSPRSRSVVIAACVVVLGTAILTSGPAGGRWLHVVSLGDGTCMVVRDGSSTTMYDAGSSSIGAVGSRVIVPELRRLGIRRIDSIVISHANRDHHNGLSEILGAFPVDRILMSDATIRSWRRGRLPDLDRGLVRAIDGGVEVSTIGRGDEFRTDTLSWRVLHPIVGESCRTINDESIVLSMSDRMERSGRAELLLCGDIQTEAMARLLRREPSLSARVMEIPHHGSWNRLVDRLVGRVDPEILVQSTGPARWRNDRLSAAVGSRDRRVTCRDGSIHIDLERRDRGFRSSEDPLRDPDRRERSDSTPP